MFIYSYIYSYEEDAFEPIAPIIPSKKIKNDLRHVPYPDDVIDDVIVGTLLKRRQTQFFHTVTPLKKEIKHPINI
jgi:hypothetical protein